MLILGVILLLGISVLYFFYHQQRSSTNLYISIMLTRPQTLAVNAPFNWVPYWMGEAIHIGDRDINPLGGVNAEVVEKESIESVAYGSVVTLVLKVNAIRDRSGVYLLRNKPLAVGSTVDLHFTSAQATGYITYMGRDIPEKNLIKLRVKVKVRSVDQSVADTVKIGSEVRDSKGMVLAKIIDKKVTQAEVPATSTLSGGVTKLSYDSSLQDLAVTMDLMTSKRNDSYYFTETQRIKVNEIVYVPFPEEAANAPITSVEVIR